MPHVFVDSKCGYQFLLGRPRNSQIRARTEQMNLIFILELLSMKAALVNFSHRCPQPSLSLFLKERMELIGLTTTVETTEVASASKTATTTAPPVAAADTTSNSSVAADRN